MANQVGYPQQVMGFPMPEAPINPFARRGQTDLMLLNQLAQGFAPVVTSPAPQMRTGFEDLPGFNQPGVMGFAMNQFVAPMLQNMMAKQGLVPGGLSSQNILDYQEAQQYREDQKQILRDTSVRDEDSYYRTIRGAQALTGQPFNAPQRAAARRLASTAAGMSPTIAPIAPELIDALAGRTGSAAVMAMRMQQFNRFRVDPVTGLTGYSRESNIQEAEKVFDEMYAPDNMAAMRGMRAGQMGSMYGEMMRRGMVGSDARPFRERVQEATQDVLVSGDAADQQAVRAIVGGRPGDPVDFGKLDAAQMDELRGLEGVQGGLRSFNADATKKSLEGYIDAVTTMREIFGDAGVSNAPMSQLIQGLEALSQGTMTQIDPGSLNMMVRTTQQLAKQSGMTIDAAIMMQQQGATTLQNLGVERAFAPSVTQGAMAFGQAATQAGVGANPVWGLENMDFQRQLDQNLRASAVAAPTTNALGALVRAQEDFGGFDAGPQQVGEADADYAIRQQDAERANRMVTAVREGRTEYDTGAKDSVGKPIMANLYDDQSMVQSMLIQQGRDQGLSPDRAAARAQNIMMQTAENRETAFENDIGSLTRRLQPEEIRRELIQPEVAGLLEGVTGLTDDQKQQAAEDFSDTMLNMDRETATDEDARITAFSESLRASVPQRGGETNKQYNRRLRGLATELEGNINERIRHDPNYGAYQDIQNLMVQQNETILGNTAVTQRMARLDAGVRDAMTGLTGHGMLASLVNAVQEGGKDDAQATMAKVLGKTFGGIQAEEISERLEGPMQDFKDRRDRVEELQRQIRLADPDEKRTLMIELETETRALDQRADQIRTIAERNGLLDDEGALDIEDITAFEDAQETVRQNRLTSSALLLRPDAGIDDATRVARAKEAGGLLHEDNMALGAGEDELLDELSAGADPSFRLALQRGSASLSEEQELRILEFRQDAIRVAPTKAEVDTAMESAGVAGGGADARRLIAGAISTERRMEKTGVTREDIRTRLGGDVEGVAVLKDMKTAELDVELDKYGVGKDVLTGMNDEGKRRLLLAERENEAIEGMTAEALTGGVEAMTQRQEGWESLTADQRDVVRQGWQDQFDTVQNIIEDTANAQFVRSAGGRGLMIRDDLKETQETDVRLRRLFGGDAGAAAVLVGGGTLAQQGRFADYVETEIAGEEADESRFFDPRGVLKDAYAKGELKGLTRDDFDRKDAKGLERLAMLGARDAQIQQQANDKRRAELVGQLKHTLGGDGMRFTLKPSEEAIALSTTPEATAGGLSAERIQELRSAYRLAGKDPDDATLADLQSTTEITDVADAMHRLGGVEPGEQFKAIRRAAQGGAAVTPATYAALDDEVKNKISFGDFSARVDDYRTVDKETKRAAVRAREADLGDPSKSLSAIGESLGLQGARLEELRQNRRLGAKFSTGEGQAWAREISGATTAITGAADDASKDPTEVYAAIREVVTSRDSGARGTAMQKLKDLTGRTDVGDLVSEGKLLEHGGVLEELAKPGTGDPVKIITEALEKLSQSDRTVEDVKDQHITMSGTLKLTDWPNSDLAASGGLNTSGIG